MFSRLCGRLLTSSLLGLVLLALGPLVHASEAEFFVAPNGNDANPGSIDAPFATLAAAQRAMRSSGIRTTFVRGGVYILTSPLILTTADNGERWSYYPPDGVDSAFLDGADLIAGGIIELEGTSNVVIDGLSIFHFVDYGIFGTSTGTVNGGNNIIVYCDIGYNSITSWSSAGIAINSMPNTIIASNYVHDVGSQGIAVYAYSPGQSINGDLIMQNVVLRAVTRKSDGGAIYTNMHNGNQADSVSIFDNFVADQGAPGTWGVHGIYVDDLSSNVNVFNNIVRAPAPNTGTTSIYGVNAVSAFFVTNGNNDVFTNNIVDLGSSGTESVAIFAFATSESIDVSMHGDAVYDNIIISSSSGPLRTANSAQNGYAYFEDINDPKGYDYTIGSNLYWNYTPGGSVFSNGFPFSDTHPFYVNPAFTNATYALSTDSPVYSLLGWSDLPSNWGPIGFSLPPLATPPSQMISQ